MAHAAERHRRHHPAGGTHWEGNDDESWGELCWPSPFGDGNGQKQRKDALLAWRPLVKPMYEAREEKRICRDIVERMGFDADDAIQEQLRPVAGLLPGDARAVRRPLPLGAGDHLDGR